MINIDYTDKSPIYEQVTRKIRELIVRGILAQDEKLPSVRSLAMELSINPNTIQRAYASLEASGFIYTVKGRGNFVSNQDRWISEERYEALGTLKNAVQSAKALGITQGEIMEIVGAEYEKNQQEVKN